MTRGRGARGCALAAAALLVSVVAGCAGTGEAKGQYAAGAGGEASLRGILLRDVFVLGPRPGEVVPADGSAPIYLTLVNGRAETDRLVSVTAPGTAREVEIPGDELTLPAGEPVRLGGDSDALLMEVLTRELRGGEYVRLAFEFEDAGTVQLSAPVMQYAGSYTTFPAPPSPTPSEAESPDRSPSGSPGGSPGPDSEGE